MADPPPPSYDDVVTGTWQEDYTIPQNNAPPLIPSALQYEAAPVSLTDVSLTDQIKYLRSSQQSLSENNELTTEAPPSYNVTVSQDGLTVSDNTQDEASPVTTTNNNDEEDPSASKLQNFFNF